MQFEAIKSEVGNGRSKYIIIYTTEVIDQMAELFQRDRIVIGKHVRNIFKEGKLQKEAVWEKFAYTISERQAEREQALTMKDWVNHLDSILTMSGERLLSENGSVTL